MKRETYCVTNTAWGYCATPELFETRKEAKEFGKQMVEDGFAWDYRLFDKKTMRQVR